MFWNLIKIALRSFNKRKGYTFINVTGLAISLACCTLIGLWIANEMSYDRHVPDVDRIFAVQVDGESLITPNALGPHLTEHLPEAQHVARVESQSEILISSASLNSFEEVLPADPAIIDLLSLEFVAGDPSTALNEPNSIIISRAIAEKFYPESNAIGKTLSFNNQTDYTITGLFEDIEPNSTLRFDLLVSIDYKKQIFKNDGIEFDLWNLATTRTFVKVQPGVTAGVLTNKITNVLEDRIEEDELILGVINLSDLYFTFSDAKKGIKIFSAIALAILLMACFNFINLSTARFKTAGKETAVRKVVGANRGSLIVRFLGESVMLMAVGLALALGLLEIALPMFNAHFQLQLSLDLFNRVSTVLIGAGIAAVVALVSGIYPALFLSRYNPVQALKNDFVSSGRNVNLRRILVVVQFSVTAVLIIGTALVYAQLNHMKSMDVGYNKEHVVNIPLRGDSRNHFATMKNELLKNPDIQAVTGAMGGLPNWGAYTSATWEGMDSEEGQSVQMNFVDYDYTKTFGIELSNGRDFDPNHKTDVQQACLINESLARMINRSDIVGSEIDCWNQHQIIGVMKDFNARPLNYEIDPMVVMMVQEGGFGFMRVNTMSVRIDRNQVESALGYIEDTWKQVLPNHPFEYSFLDEQFDANYKSLDQLSNLAACFGLLAVLVAGLGLFGLASFTVEQRTKEIGIRKVLGASVGRIVHLLSKEYLLLVFISNLVAWPLAWYAMDRWLSEFAYHIDMSFGTFALVAFLTLVVAMLAVGYQALRAGASNLVEAIGYE
ncbi:MAG: ABC transporter permease [candidate division Zixibacteria bacterium]|nr:ABC transporter permease [candidate division Zixibacteria bacterium]MDH3936697.1 ABC transporter permease [candidate division Zixibacteria bacterium]MDH4034069.1 ABC transporter permease [candidate division Zixibacteria bacterium]